MNISPFPAPPGLGNHYSTLWLKDYFLDFTYKGYHTKCLSPDLCHPAQCPQDPSMLLKNAGLPSSLWLNDMPMYICYISFIHSLTDGDIACFNIVSNVANGVDLQDPIFKTPLAKEVKTNLVVRSHQKHQGEGHSIEWSRLKIWKRKEWQRKSLGWEKKEKS